MDLKKKGKARNLSKKVADTASELVYGDRISAAMFLRHKFTVLLAIGMVMLYIAFKYECKTHQETIVRLENQLERVKSESIRLQSEYNSRTRESHMVALIDSMGLSLTAQEQPPFVLVYDTPGKTNQQ